MNERKIWDALGEIDSGLIEEAGKRLAEKGEFIKARERRRAGWRIVMRVGGMAAMAGLVILLGARFGSVSEEISMQHSEKNLLIQRASEPERPDRRIEMAADEKAELGAEKKVEIYDASPSQPSSMLAEDDLKGLGFYEASIRQTLLNHAGENIVYSPVNLYLALGMLSEISNGNTRQDILSVMGEEGLENARKQCMDLQSQLCWRKNTFEPVLGHSLWLGAGIDYAKEMVSCLAEDYCASVFQGAGGTERAQAAGDWLDDFLMPVPEQEIGRETSQSGFDLLSAFSYGESWREGDGFDWRGMGEGMFYQRDGRDREISFIMGTVRERDVRMAERYGAVDLDLSGGNCLSVYLPKEGVDVEEVLRKDLRGILSGIRDGENEDGENEDGGQNLVQVSLPEFQVSSDISLNHVLEDLGLRDIFQEGLADFSPLLAEEKGRETEQEASPYVGEIRQSAGLMLDEAGCRTGFRQETVNAGKRADGNGDGQKDENAFICNRPFVFIIWSQEKSPVLAGMVGTFE